MNNVIDLVAIKKIKSLNKSIENLREINHIIGNSILSLTKFDNYSSVKKVLEDLFILHRDIKRSISTKEEILERLEDEQN